MLQIIVKTVLLYMVHLVPHMLYCFLKSRIICQKNLYSPKTKIGSRHRSCGQHKWFNDYPWLHYDLDKNKVFCIYCMKHSSKLTTEKNKDPTFITAGFKSWHKALECFKDHQNSKCHRGAATFEVIVPSCSYPSTMMSEQLTKSRAEE